MAFIDARQVRSARSPSRTTKPTATARCSTQVIPDPIAAMKAVACQVCTILYRDPDEVKRNPASIRLHIYDFDGVANAGGDTISFSSRHIANYDEPEDARFEFLGVLIHETTHLYQYDDGGGGLVEGMADFVRIRAGHHRMNRRTRGGAWTDAYTTSGFFFSWLAGPGGLQKTAASPADPDIGWAINQRMDGNWSEQVFMDRLDARRGRALERVPGSDPLTAAWLSRLRARAATRSGSCPSSA